MTSEPIRNPLVDHLLTPQNSALVVIDYQPNQIRAVTSMDQALLVRNIVSVARTAKNYRLPIVLSTVNVANGSGPTITPVLQVSLLLRFRPRVAGIGSTEQEQRGQHGSTGAATTR